MVRSSGADAVLYLYSCAFIYIYIYLFCFVLFLRRDLPRRPLWKHGVCHPELSCSCGAGLLAVALSAPAFFPLLVNALPTLLKGLMPKC